MNLNDFLEKKKTPKKYRKQPSVRLVKTAALVAKGKSVSKAMVEAGFSPTTARNPQDLTSQPQWTEVLNTFLNDGLLGKTHLALMTSHTLGHMVFPLGPKGSEDINLSGARPDTDDDEDEETDKRLQAERTTLTDEEIKAMLAEVSCKVTRIVHGEHARHVYFWAPDNKSRKDALDLAYKLKGKYAPEKHMIAVTEVNEAKRKKIHEILGIKEPQK